MRRKLIEILWKPISSKQKLNKILLSNLEFQRHLIKSSQTTHVL